MLQTGVQILGGFLLTLPFHARFADLDDRQRWSYLALVLLAGVCIIAMLVPIAVHRRVFGWHRKELTVRAGHTLSRIVLFLVALLISGIVAFVFDVVAGGAVALTVGVLLLLGVLLALVVVPLLAGGRRPH